MTDPITPATGEGRVLHALTVGVRGTLDASRLHHVAGTVDLSTRLDRVAERLAMRLKADVLAEQLPPQTIRHTVTAVEELPHWATWWDHAKATYAGRWWARWWVRRHPAAVTWHPVRAVRTVEVEVRAAWKFPHAPHIPTELGRAVLYTTTEARTYDP